MKTSFRPDRSLQENGVTTAIEALYRDMEYARSLIRRAAANDEGQEEEATIRGRAGVATVTNKSPHSHPVDSPSGGGAPSEDWSVISSDPEELQLSVASSGSRPGSRKPSLSKRSSLTSAVLSVLPDALTSSTRRPRSASSASAT